MLVRMLYARERQLQAELEEAEEMLAMHQELVSIELSNHELVWHRDVDEARRRLSWIQNNIREALANPSSIN